MNGANGMDGTTRVSILLLGFVCTVGCDRFGCEREQLSPPPTIRRPGRSEEAPGSGVALPRTAESKEQKEKRQQRSKMLAAGPIERKIPTEKTERNQRDLEAELRRLVGNPASCLKSRSQKDGPKTIRILVRATVMPTGSITRAYVASSSLSKEERSCIDGRVTAARFAAPVKGAPHTVQTAIEIRQSGL